MNDEYIKLEKYKNKCENYINYLRDENSKIVLKLNKLYEEQQQQQSYNRNKNQSNSNTYRRLKNLKFNPPQEEEEEEEGSTQEDVEEDITDQNLLIKKNKPPPNKIRKIKKGISKFI